MSSAGVTAHHPLRARRLLSGRVVVGLAVVQALGFGLWLPGLGRNVVTGLAVAFPLAVLWVWRALSRPVTPATTAADSRTSTKVVAGGFAVMMGLTCQAWVIVVAVAAVLAILAAPAVLVVWRRAGRPKAVPGQRTRQGFRCHSDHVDILLNRRVATNGS